MEWRSSACTKVSARDASASSPRRSSAGRWLLYLLLLSVASSSSLLLVWSSAPLSPFRSPLNGSELTQTGKLSALPMGDTVERNLRCIGWRATLDCTPFGPRDPLRDQPCGRTVGDSGAGYCEVEDADTGEHFRVMRRHCTSLFHAVRLRCDDALAFVDFRVKARKAVAKALAPGFALPNVAAEFERTGAVFWPDYWHPKHSIFNIHEKSMLWELLDMPYADMFEQESGQLLIDRRRHAAPMKLAFFYMFHRPNFFQKLQVAHGDKDLFRFAWLKLEAPFHMILTPPAVAGKVVDDLFCGMTMAQHDLEGDVLFLHRNQFKLTGKLAGLKKERCQRPMDSPTWLSGRTCCLSTARLKSSTT
ncbi:hypothetical protein PF010_g7657 [Phytophthora fragariae]|uniref:Uncharacterized protein n=1 Tax=Phytophthora fragariae TaxID=53985 RepID=A0A6A3L459_9STRA|nr:hypothetical protein PF011_g8804 [Phytophthora fragariae]KAE9119986.1 hypothetical protein PF010_g7657 [Phytophthora fragariae]KAE9236409.1 hypothetical protein PF004_g8849 [Phytophthora fragariae]